MCLHPIDTENGIPEVIILDPAGHKTTVPVKMRKISHNRWKCEYVSNLIGLHSVNVFFGGIPVRNSPFGVKIASSKVFLHMHISRAHVNSYEIFHILSVSFLYF